MRSRPFRVGTLAVCLACATALTASCTGDDPFVVGTKPDEKDDASTTPSQDSSTTPPPGNDATADVDSGVAADADAAAPEKRFCSLADRDGGVDASAATPPQVQWSPNPPQSAGVPAVISALTHGGCTVNVATVALTPPGQPPSTGILLYKVDAQGGTCSQPKGFRLLGSTYAADPSVIVGQHSFDPRLFVVAFSTKGQSGGSPSILSVAQYDFTTGETLHHAAFAVTGVQGGPPGPSTATMVTVLGCNLILRGSGTFAGATGNNTGVFSATYTGFLAPEAQPTSFADSAYYVGG
jgi:hypothetical protein